MINTGNLETNRTNNYTEIEMVVGEFNNNVIVDVNSEITDKEIKYVESIVRNSYEYKKYIKYLKENLDITRCSLLDGIDIKDLEVTLEFHHFPLSLFDLTTIIINKLIALKKEVSYFDIAEEIMKCHYENSVGLIPLTSTIHEMAHKKSITIPYDKIYGNFMKFIYDNTQYLTDEIKERLENNISASYSVSKEENDKKIKFSPLSYKIKYLT